MLKYLAVVALIFGLSLYVSIQYKQHAKNPTNRTQRSGAEVSAAGTDQQPKEDEVRSEWDPPRWYRLFGWPEGIGVWGLFLTLVVIAEQTGETKRAAEAARDSARLQQAEMVIAINRERPYLVVTAEAVGQNEFVLRAKNEGNTPARIASVWHRPIVTKRDKNVEIPSDERTAESSIEHLPLLLPPKGGFMVLKWGDREMQGISLPPISSLHFYLRIRYFNTLESDQIQAYETRCLYWAIPAGDRVPIPDPRHPEHNTWS